ncbi:hypothetical protein BCR33DRAFT_565660 [Rhizoclosmatium globosum]|uniref:Uncharacterized protein n=1 Tax=Rhizoclosmatium globosum TaxID=329046 RepID=A0A1Y2B7C1_9FUNG|nr:hypothetical protein BCR33DRAFT_565660 [Rhizoclosmatium globosum]|eukprot:ORY30440.1 hypothetical protein BCR33DRAFT_565660 [Rhizoclosmatium globosum]
MLLKLKPSASTSKLKLSDGFISGTPGLGPRLLLFLGCCCLVSNGKWEAAAVHRLPGSHVRSICQIPKRYLRLDHPPTPFTLLSKSETLMTANKQTSPYLQKQAPSSTKQQRVTEIHSPSRYRRRIRYPSTEYSAITVRAIQRLPIRTQICPSRCV